MALIDCGEGMQKRIIDHNRRLKSSGSQHRTCLSRTRAIFLTHGHLDHTWGAPLLQTWILMDAVHPWLSWVLRRKRH